MSDNDRMIADLSEELAAHQSLVLKLKAELAESQKIRGMKQYRIAELENTLAAVRGDKTHRKRMVLSDGQLVAPVEATSDRKTENIGQESAGDKGG